MAMHQITDHIWIGSMMSLSAEKTLRKHNVSSILSVLDIAATGQDPEKFKALIHGKFKHLYLDIQDVEEEDIMQFFPRTNEFIEEAVSNGTGVLVHCIAGISRSVTCACAYIMRANKWGVQQTVEFVKSKRAIANPNPSFLEQLEVYYQCGYEVSDDKKPYREWKLKQQAAEFKTQALAGSVKYTKTEMPPLVITWRHVLAMLVPAEEAAKINQVLVNDKAYAITEPISASLKNPDTDSVELVGGNDKVAISHEKLKAVFGQLATRTVVLRCKGCSSVVANSGSFVYHKPASPERCQLYFLEPIEWMRPELERGDIEGKIACPKCNHKLGSYQWQGSKCSCGAWITPAIKFQKARVDEMSTKSRPSVL